MAKASDNAFPSILITEGTEPSAPAAGKQRLYIDSTSHKLKRTDSGGVDVTIEGSQPAFHGAKVYNDGTQSITNNAATAVNMGAEEYDTDGFHFTSTANLTGTVTKNGTTAIVGSSTLFTSELTVGQIISVPGTTTEKRVVTVITDNTNLTVGVAFVNSASGQTAARVNSGISCPSAALAGKYRFSFHASFAAVNTTGVRIGFLRKNTIGDDTTNLIGSRSNLQPISASLGADGAGTADVDMAFGDFVELYVYQTSTGSLNSGDALSTDRGNVNMLECHFLG